MVSKVVIIGAGAGFEYIRDYEKNKDYEIWCVPTIFPILMSHRVDKVFEFHSPENWNAGIDYESLESRLVLSKPVNSTPKALVLSIDSLQQKYGLVFSSSVAWMVGHALQTGVKEIVLIGVDMDNEYTGQRDGLFFLLGFAKATNVKITIPTSSKINIFGRQYGWV